RLDIDHPKVINYIKTCKAKKTKDGESKEDSHYSKGAALEEYMDWPLRDLVARFGTDESFKRWVDAAKVLADIRLKDLKADEMMGKMIPRELVKTHIFGAIENSNLRLLSDLPKTLSQRLQAHFKSGGTTEEGEELGRELIGSQLKSLKSMAIRVLKKKDA
ncbi:MAG: hypothetical protein ACTSYO_05030, partial [Candidatus Ranarchaeia archaeon]